MPKEVVACSTNQQCSDANGGAPFRCLKAQGLCVPLTSAECPRIQGPREDYLNDDAIFYGVSSLPAVGGALKEAAVDLARQQINSQKIPSASPGGNPRPLVGIACSTEPSANGLGSTAAAVRAIRHLSEVVKVAAIVGPDLAPTVFDTFDQYLKPNNVLSFQTNSSTTLTPEVHNGLIVSMIGGNDAIHRLTAGLTRDYLEPRTLTDGIRVAGEPLRVEFLVSNNTTTASTVNRTISELRFNNLPATENGSNFKVIDIGDTQNRVAVPDPTQNIARAIADTAAFRPHVVIILAQPALAPALLAPLDAQIPDPKPLYVTQLGSWATVIVGTIGNRDSLRKRYVGITGSPAATDTALLTEMTINFESKFPDFGKVNLAPLLNVLTSYDAMFALAYSIVAAGPVPIDGAAVASGMKRLASGKEIPVGVTSGSMQQGFAALQGGSSITFKGITGGLAFDEAGQRPYGARTYCVRGTPVATSVFNMTYTYLTSTKQITGSPDILAVGQCP